MSLMDFDYDLFVIGGGSGGVLASQALIAGMRSDWMRMRYSMASTAVSALRREPSARWAFA